MSSKSKALAIIEKLLPAGLSDAEHLAARKAMGPEKTEKYLKALDIVHGDAATRAKDMGFGPETYYHGTRSDFPAFDNSKLGSSTGAASAKKAHFFAERPDLAADYAEIAPNPGGKATIYNQKYLDAEKAIKNATPDTPEEYSAIKNLSDVVKGLNEEGQQILPVKLNTKDSLIHNFKGQEYRDSTYNKILKDADGKGAILQNTMDPVYTTNNKAQNIIAVQDPSKIRSTNAAFDPRYKNSKNLVAGAGVFPLALNPDEKDTSMGTRIQNAFNAAIDPALSKAKQIAQAVAESKIGKPLVAGFDAANEARDKFIAQSANQMDISRNSVNPKGDPEMQQHTRTVLDLALPAPADALLAGGGKLAGKIVKEAGAFNKLGTLGNEAGSLTIKEAKTAAQLKKGNMAADAAEKAGTKVVADAQELREIERRATQNWGERPKITPSKADLDADILKARGRAKLAAKQLAESGHGKMTAAEYIAKFGKPK